jgi:hypothetical protein
VTEVCFNRKARAELAYKPLNEQGERHLHRSGSARRNAAQAPFHLLPPYLEIYFEIYFTRHLLARTKPAHPPPSAFPAPAPPRDRLTFALGPPPEPKGLGPSFADASTIRSCSRPFMVRS